MQARDEGNLNFRLEALSDGVIAITITLLVLDLHVPPADSIASPGALLDALAGEWPAFMAYVTSFVVILIMWVNHRNVLRIIHGPDVPFHLLNGLLLLMITVVPFSTGLFAEHLGHAGERTAGAVYAGTWVLIALVFQAWWHYAARHRRLIAEHVSDDHVRAITRAYRIALPAYGLAFALAFVSVPASFALIAALAVFYAVTASTAPGMRVRPRGT